MNQEKPQENENIDGITLEAIEDMRRLGEDIGDLVGRFLVRAPGRARLEQNITPDGKMKILAEYEALKAVHQRLNEIK